MKISLIVATLSRVIEVQALLVSLCAQNYLDLEVIIVDQNQDDRLAQVILEFESKISIHRLRSPVRNLSHARDVGVASATGIIIGFPDDDCVYPPGVLTRVSDAFEADAALDVLTGPAFSPDNHPGSGRWQMRSGPIGMENVWTTVIAFNLFIRATRLRQVGGFDESFGVGARFGSGEETDLVIRIIKTGGKCLFDFTLRIIHPDKTLTKVATARAFQYGTGLGQVLRKHRAPAPTAMVFFIRPVGGMLVSLLKMNLLGVAYYWHTLRGRIFGFVTRPDVKLVKISK
jgi:glycosyltransferase involved in cell wall biosynthesis